jgi:hypothetical protein
MPNPGRCREPMRALGQPIMQKYNLPVEMCPLPFAL